MVKKSGVEMIRTISGVYANPNIAIASPDPNKSSKPFQVRDIIFCVSFFSMALVRTGRSEFRKIVPYIIPTSTIFIGRA